MLVGSEAKHATYLEVCSVPTDGFKAATVHDKTGNYIYRPVGYATFADALRDDVSDALGSNPVYETYALNKSGSQLFGRISWDSGIPGMMIEVAFRSSLDGTLCLEWAIGQGAFICANGMFNAAQILKIKHTHNVLERFAASLEDHAGGVQQKIENARQRIAWMDGLKEIPMSHDLFNAFVGVLQGRRIEGTKTPMLTAHRASAARRYWGACHDGDLHDDHAGNDLFSGYQALTGANHLSTPRNAISDCAGVDFMVEQVEKSGGCLTGIPAFNFQVEEF